jgi:hypothetical protein
MLRHDRLIALAPLLFALCVTSSVAFAKTDVAVGGIRMERQGNVPGVPGDVDDSLEAKVPPTDPDKDDAEDTADGGEEKAAKKGGVETIIAPIPSRSPLLGWTLSLPVMLLYRPPDSNPENQVWVSGIFGFYAENDSWGAGMFQKMSLGGDAWRLKAALFHADLNYDYYGIGGDGSGQSIPLSQPMDLLTAEALRRVAPNLYIGLKAVYSDVEVGPDLADVDLPPGFDPDSLRVNLTLPSINPRLQYDSRDSEFYPHNGFLIDFNMPISREEFGSDADFEKYELAVNNYFAVNDSDVLATRIAIKYVDDNAPFFMYPAFGQGADLRGYQTGTYRDRFLFAAQTEYRHRFTPRIGAVAFVGVGTVSDTFAEWNKTLASYGAGFRFVLAPKNDISLRIDIARGRDETIYYVGIGEAF